MSKILIVVVIICLVLAGTLGYAYASYRSSSKIESLNKSLNQLEIKNKELSEKSQALSIEATRKEDAANAKEESIDKVSNVLTALKATNNSISNELKKLQNDAALAKQTIALPANSGSCVLLCQDRMRLGYPCWDGCERMYTIK